MSHVPRRSVAWSRRRSWGRWASGLALAGALVVPWPAFSEPTETKPEAAVRMVGNLARAEEHPAALRQIGLLPCDELGDLDREITPYRQRTGAGQ